MRGMGQSEVLHIPRAGIIYNPILFGDILSLSLSLSLVCACELGVSFLLSEHNSEALRFSTDALQIFCRHSYLQPPPPPIEKKSHKVKFKMIASPDEVIQKWWQQSETNRHMYKKELRHLGEEAD